MSGRISGPSPMFFNTSCVQCGRDASLGRRGDNTQYYYPPYVYLGILLGLIPLIIFQYAFRKPLHLSYSLCPDCNHRRTVKKRITLALWLVVPVTFVAAIAVDNARILILTAVVFVAATVMSFLIRCPLMVAGYNEPFFVVKGFGDGFVRLGLRPTPYDPVHYSQAPAYAGVAPCYQQVPAYQQAPPQQPQPSWDPLDQYPPLQG